MDAAELVEGFLGEDGSVGCGLLVEEAMRIDAVVLDPRFAGHTTHCDVQALPPNAWLVEQDQQLADGDGLALKLARGPPSQWPSIRRYFGDSPGDVREWQLHEPLGELKDRRIQIFESTINYPQVMAPYGISSMSLWFHRSVNGDRWKSRRVSASPLENFASRFSMDQFPCHPISTSIISN